MGQGNSDFEREAGIRDIPLVWDRPWSTTLNLDFRVDERSKPTFFGWETPANWSVNLLYRAWAGTRYTARAFDENGVPRPSVDQNGEIGPYRSSLDIKFTKFYPFGRNQKLTMFIEGKNILDHDNWRRVNPWTGQPYHRGNWDGGVASAQFNDSPRNVNDVKYVEDTIDPSFRTDPRRLVMGVTLQW